MWQNRFFSCPLDERHFFAALRYVELNPVRAGLAGLPWDWPWSSAAQHICPADVDPLLDPDWQEYTRGWNAPEWQEILLGPLAEEEASKMRDATLKGEPLGSPDFVAGLEAKAGRRLRVMARGRPRRTAGASALVEQSALFE